MAEEGFSKVAVAAVCAGLGMRYGKMVPTIPPLGGFASEGAVGGILLLVGWYFAKGYIRLAAMSAGIGLLLDALLRNFGA
jgi:hypothetical protein